MRASERAARRVLWRSPRGPRKLTRGFDFRERGSLLFSPHPPRSETYPRGRLRFSCQNENLRPARGDFARQVFSEGKSTRGFIGERNPLSPSIGWLPATRLYYLNIRFTPPPTPSHPLSKSSAKIYAPPRMRREERGKKTYSTPRPRRPIAFICSRGNFGVARTRLGGL